MFFFKFSDVFRRISAGIPGEMLAWTPEKLLGRISRRIPSEMYERIPERIFKIIPKIIKFSGICGNSWKDLRRNVWRHPWTIYGRHFMTFPGKSFPKWNVYRKFVIAIFLSDSKNLNISKSMHTNLLIFVQNGIHYYSLNEQQCQ